jgi:hypothetical protein
MKHWSLLIIGEADCTKHMEFVDNRNGVAYAVSRFCLSGGDPLFGSALRNPSTLDLELIDGPPEIRTFDLRDVEVRKME